MSSPMRTAAVLVLGAVLGVSASVAHRAWADKASLPWREARLFAEVFEHIRADYVDDVPAPRLGETAVRGMVGTLDPYSAYLDPKEIEELRINTAGEYAGVGVEISLEDGSIKVIGAIDDSPAARAGIRAGDTIVAVDSIAVDPEHLDESVERLRGRPGSRVELTIARNLPTAPLTFNLTRERVQVHSVKRRMLDGGYGYVRISQFSETTAADFAAAIAALQHDQSGNMHGLVLDLRNNPGGVLEAATEVADDLLNDGVIVTAEGRSRDARFSVRATPGDALKGAPIVVLVNGGSASAAEILAGALKDNRRASLMGQRTFGKGSVQTIMPLSDGGALKLTTSHYHTPSGASIQHRGIAPDFATQAKTDGDIRSSEPARDDDVRLALTKLRELQASIAK